MIRNIITRLSLLFKIKTKSPTLLFELSHSQSKRVQSNSIHLSIMSRVNGKSLYSHIEYGSRIPISNKKIGIGKCGINILI